MKREMESSHFVFTGYKSVKLLWNVPTGFEGLQNLGGSGIYVQELPLQNPGHDG